MVLSTTSTTSLEDVAAASSPSPSASPSPSPSPSPLPTFPPLFFQLYFYNDRSLTSSLIRRATPPTTLPSC